MSEPFIAEIHMFAGNFAPRGWAFCDGQILPIAQNTALFALVGTTYGGDGRTTLGLPDLRGRVPMHAGASSGPGLLRKTLGQKDGVESVALTATQMPTHTHGTLQASSSPATEKGVYGNVPAVGNEDLYGAGSSVEMAANPEDLGTGIAHPNVQPSLCVNYIIALTGLFPSRI